jgi:hypothetical protein
MSRNVTLKMDAFGARAFGELARRHGGSASRLLRMAAHYYLADSDDERLGWRVPSLAREEGADRRGVAVQVQLDDATWTALAREARRQRVAVATLATHAVLYFIADVDSGRLAQRMGETL